MDSQSVKNTDTAGHKGYDAGKKVSGIKRHIAVDTQGLPHAIHVTTADVTDRAGALAMFDRRRADLSQVQKVLVDGGYTGKPFATAVQGLLGASVEVVKRNELHTFVVLPKRWVVERSFAWLEKCRRLWKNCERKLNTSLQMVVLAFTVLGSVDISPQPDESGGEMQEAQVSGVQLLKPGEYPAIVLDLVDEAFHQMALPVQMPVIVGGCLAVRAGRNDRYHTQFQDVLAKLLGIVPFVGQYVLASITGDQLLRLGDVVLLPPGQDESQGVAQAVYAHVNLGAEPAAAPAQGLGRLATLWGGAPAAQGCARTTVLSMIRYSRSASSQQC